MLTIEFLKKQRNQYYGFFGKWFVCCSDKPEIIALIEKMNTRTVDPKQELSLVLIIVDMARQYNYAYGESSYYRLLQAITEVVGYDVINTMCLYSPTQVASEENYLQIKTYCENQRRAYKDALEMFQRQINLLREKIEQKRNDYIAQLSFIEKETELYNETNRKIDLTLKFYRKIKEFFNGQYYKYDAVPEYWKYPYAKTYPSQLLQVIEKFNELIKQYFVNFENIKKPVINDNNNNHNQVYKLPLCGLEIIDITDLAKEKPDFSNLQTNNNNQQIEPDTDLLDDDKASLLTNCGSIKNNV